MSFLFGGRSNTAKASTVPANHFSSGSIGQGTRSLELVRYNADTGKFEVGTEALAALKASSGPIGVVAVAGRARQGKSYILNQLLGRSGGFQVGPTHRPCTKGLWMWSAPVERRAANGTKYSLVLLDTEGIDAYDQTGQYSTQIFSLAVLLSSLFVYNQMGGIDEAALDRLSLVTEMTKHIRVRASDGGDGAEDPTELASFTPSFIWLLRDFYLKLEEDGRVVTPRDYLEAALQALPGASPAASAKNQIRSSIKALFPDRDCFTLVRPVNDEDTLAKLDTLSPGQLRPEFRDGLSRLTRLVFSKALPKRLGTQVLTGPLLAGLTEAYVTAINAGAVPTIATAWQGVAEAESRRAADAAEAAYQTSFPVDIAADDAMMEAAHAAALASAQREFDAVAIGDPSVKAANEKRWKEACSSRFKELREKKLASAELACVNAINEGTARLQAVIRRDGATLGDLQREAAAFQQAYSNSREIVGPTKWKRLAEFMRDVYGGAQRDLAARQSERQRVAASTAAAAAAAAQKDAQQATQRAIAAESSTDALRARIADLERRLERADAEVASARQATAAATAQLTELRQGAHGRDLERNALASRVTELQESEAQLRIQIGTLQQQLVGMAREAEGAARQSAARATADVQGWDAERARLQATLTAVTAARDEAMASKACTEQAAAAEVADLRSQLTLAQAEVAAARAAAGPTAPQIPVPSVPFHHDDTSREDVDMRSGEDPGMLASPGSPSRSKRKRTSSGAAAPVGVGIPETKKMTVNAMKEWLMANGHEAKVWEMSQKKAKKKEFEDFINSL